MGPQKGRRWQSQVYDWQSPIYAWDPAILCCYAATTCNVCQRFEKGQGTARTQEWLGVEITTWNQAALFCYVAIPCHVRAHLSKRLGQSTFGNGYRVESDIRSMS